MKSRSRLALIWILLAAAPFQALIAIHLELRGPAHFHHDHDDHMVTRGVRLGHSHGDVEHHHHDHDTSVIVVDDGESIAADQLEDSLVQGMSSALSFVLVASDGRPGPPRSARLVHSERVDPFRTRTLERLERPPRIVPC